MSRVRAALAGLLSVLVVTAAPALATGSNTLPAPSSSVADGVQPGRTVQLTDGPNSYRVYTPRTYRAGQRLPLYVMVHGCNTNAAEQEAANLLNPLADRERFVVLYVDHDQTQNAQAGTHPGRCWRFYSGPADQRRGQGDPETIARQTRAVISRWGIDRSRVYLTGMSSGAMMSANLAGAYPDLYAAVANVAGCAYAAGPACVFGAATDTDGQARAAHAEQGRRARDIPVLAVHGDKDTTVSPNNSPLVVQQALKTSNLALSGSLTRPLSLRPASSTVRRPAGRYSYTDETYRDRQGRVVAQRVLIHGMGHFWPGGSSNPASADFTDPKGPSGAHVTWRFLSQYRLVNGRTIHPTQKTQR